MTYKINKSLFDLYVRCFAYRLQDGVQPLFGDERRLCCIGDPVFPEIAVAGRYVYGGMRQSQDPKSLVGRILIAEVQQTLSRRSWRIAEADP